VRSLTELGTALTCTTFGRKVKGAVLRTASRHVSAPAPTLGLTWVFAWQVLDSNQGRHTSTVLQIMTVVTAALRITWANILARASGYALVPRISRAWLPGRSIGRSGR